MSSSTEHHTVPEAAESRQWRPQAGRCRQHWTRQGRRGKPRELAGTSRNCIHRRSEEPNNKGQTSHGVEQEPDTGKTESLISRLNRPLSPLLTTYVMVLSEAQGSVESGWPKTSIMALETVY